MTALRQTMSDDPIGRIRWRLTEMAAGRSSADDRLVHWRTISRLAHDAYEKELSELESLSVPMADVQLTATYGEPVG